MKRLFTFACGLGLIAACSKTPTVQGAAVGNDQGAAVGNELTSSRAPLETRPVATTGQRAKTARPTSPEVMPSNPVKKVFGGGAEYREVTIPAGTVLPVTLETSVGSDTSRVEQPVSGRLRRAVMVGGAEVLPAGTTVSGHVTTAQRPGRVKGRGLIGMRFTELDTPGPGRTRISTATISRMAPATKGKDAIEILGPAAAGAVIGRIAGGKGAARKGAVIGGGAGAGYVLSTRGKEVRLGKGAPLAVRLTAPVTVRVRGR